MDKKHVFAALSLVSFASILFMPSGSIAWIYMLLLGVVFGIIWFFMKG